MYAIDVSINFANTVSVEGFRQHIQTVIPSSGVTATYQFTKSKGNDKRRIYGKIVFVPSQASQSLDRNTVKTYATQLRKTKFHDQPVHAQMDPLSPIAIQKKQQKKQQQQQQQQQLASGGVLAIATNNNNNQTSPKDAVIQEEEEHNDGGALHWKNSKLVATNFFDWLHLGDYSGWTTVESTDASACTLDLTSIDRDQVHELFEAFASQQQHPSLDATTGISNKEKKKRRRLESLVMSVLKRQKLLKTKRYNDDGIVVCSFARSDKTLAPLQERKTARHVLIQEREMLISDKGGIHVDAQPTTDPTGPVMPINHTVTAAFPIGIVVPSSSSPPPSSSIQLTKVRMGGSHKKHFHVTTKLPCQIPGKLELSLNARSTGVYRTTVLMTFQNKQTNEQFDILRSVLLRAGDADLYDLLQPSSPYVKKQRRKYEKHVGADKDKILNPPPQSAGRSFKYTDLKHFRVPLDVREMVENREMEGALVPPDFDMPDSELPTVYSSFWQNLLWMSELQAYDDIQLFDIEDASLQRSGRFFKLYVAGLAEGRPSVLRGDMVMCTWKGKKYQTIQSRCRSSGFGAVHLYPHGVSDLACGVSARARDDGSVHAGAPTSPCDRH